MVRIYAIGVKMDRGWQDHGQSGKYDNGRRSRGVQLISNIGYDLLQAWKGCAIIWIGTVGRRMTSGPCVT